MCGWAMCVPESFAAEGGATLGPGVGLAMAPYTHLGAEENFLGGTNHACYDA
jgi:hypothetical protein